MRAAVESGVLRICQASSVNAIGQAYSRAPRYDYFPIDEAHRITPGRLQPVEMGLRAAGRRARPALRGPQHRLAALPWVLPTGRPPWRGTRSRAGGWTGISGLHRREPPPTPASRRRGPPRRARGLYIVAPTRPQARRAASSPPAFPRCADPRRPSGRVSFMTSAKAGRLLGWVHPARGELKPIGFRTPAASVTSPYLHFAGSFVPQIRARLPASWQARGSPADGSWQHPRPRRRRVLG